MSLAGGLGATMPAAANQQPTESSAGAPTYLVIFRPGPAWPDGARINDLPLRDHGRYLLGLHRAKQLLHAGRFADDSGGAAMFEAPDDEAARAIVEADPAVIARIFTFQLHRWALVPWSEIAASPTR